MSDIKMHAHAAGTQTLGTVKNNPLDHNGNIIPIFANYFHAMLPAFLTQNPSISFTDHGTIHRLSFHRKHTWDRYFSVGDRKVTFTETLELDQEDPSSVTYAQHPWLLVTFGSLDIDDQVWTRGIEQVRETTVDVFNFLNSGKLPG